MAPAPNTLDRDFPAEDRNAVRERFFWSLKHEWTNHETYGHPAEERLSAFKSIETFYNTQRLHQTLDYTTPEQYAADHASAAAAQPPTPPQSESGGRSHRSRLGGLLKSYSRQAA